MPEVMTLVRPTSAHLPSFIEALNRGWDPPGTTAAQVLARVGEHPEAFLAEAEDREGTGPPIALPDGSLVRRLPSTTRWLWDGEFAGRIDLRWEVGTTALPPTCLGHVGYVVVPWKRRRGYATSALRQMLPEARALGLPYIELTTDPTNVGSQRVIEANGGVLWERITKPAAHGGTEGVRYRIALG